jgi:hypothetical protein
MPFTVFGCVVIIEIGTLLVASDTCGGGGGSVCLYCFVIASAVFHVITHGTRVPSGPHGGIGEG